MAKGRFDRVRVAAIILAAVGSVLTAIPMKAGAQTYVGTRGESPADALARNMKQLGSSPRNFDALIGAGRASLALGDGQAAAGFFGRAEEVWPASPLPQAGMGAALALEGDGNGALQYFARATQRGATQSTIGADRGLAYDLTGQHALAQADYRAALPGSDGDEARRRLALSLAITGNKAEALSILSPLMARGDAAGARTRAFVLALTGDVNGAKAAIDAAMPGSSTNMAYFFRKLPGLRSEQKVAAVNLGMFPSDTELASAGSSSPQVAMTTLPGAQQGSPRSSEVGDDRMGSIERWLSQGNQGVAVGQSQPPAAQLPQQIASARPPTATARSAATATPRLWIQLASGSNASDLPGQFHRIKRRNRDLFEGISGYIAEEPGRARLLIGPFRNSEEAGIFAQDLASVRVDAFTWTNQPGQTIRKLPSE